MPEVAHLDDPCRHAGLTEHDLLGPHQHLDVAVQAAREGLEVAECAPDP